MDRASWCEEARRIVVRELKPGKDVEELSEKIVRTILHMKETEAPRKQMFAKTGKYIQQFLEQQVATAICEHYPPLLPQPPQPEVAVSERDYAQRLIDAMWDKHHINDWGDPAGCYDIIKQHINEAIANHMATERGEAEKVKAELDGVQDSWNRLLASYEEQGHQLAATEAKLREVMESLEHLEGSTGYDHQVIKLALRRLRGEEHPQPTSAE